MKRTKIILWIGIALLLIGAVIFGVSFTLSGFNFQFLSNVKTVTKRFEESADNPIQSIVIDFDNAEIEVRVQDDIDTLTIEYPQAQNKKGENISEIKVEETQGAISITETYKWQAQLFSWNVSNPTVVLYLPAHRAYSLDLSSNNGEIRFTQGALNASAIALHTNNGAVTTTQADIACSGDIQIETDNGAIKLGFMQANALKAETDNGEVSLSDCSVAQTVSLESDNGAIVLTGELKANEFIVETNNGAIGGSGVIQANKITLSTDLGNVSAKLSGKKSDYTITVERDLGNTNIHSQTGGEKILSVSSDLGNIQIDFTE